MVDLESQSGLPLSRTRRHRHHPRRKLMSVGNRPSFSREVKLQWAGSRERNLASGRGRTFFLTSLFIELIDELPQWKRPSQQVRDLPGGRRIFVRVSNGPSLIVAQGGGPFRVDGINGIIAVGQRGLVLKLLDHTRKALGQLYADLVPDDYRRLLFARWKPPEQFVVTPEGLEEVRRNVQQSAQAFVGTSFPHFALVIMHTGENPDQAPRAEWD